MVDIGFTLFDLHRFFFSHIRYSDRLQADPTDRRPPSPELIWNAQRNRQRESQAKQTVKLAVVLTTELVAHFCLVRFYKMLHCIA